MQNRRLRVVYRQQKWPLPVPVRKIMAPGRKIMSLGCRVFHYSVKCSKHGLRGFIDTIHGRIVTQMVTMLMSYWQVLSEVELQRIFDIVYKRWANSSFACICTEEYGSIHGATRTIHLLIVWKSSTYHQPQPGGLASGSYCIFTLAVHEPPGLASCIEIYYFLAAIYFWHSYRCAITVFLGHQFHFIFLNLVNGKV